MSMDSEQDATLSISRVQCCDCECACSSMNQSNSGAWLKKFREFEVEKAGFEIPSLDVAKVELVDECAMLREMVTSQQQRIDNLSVELEEERNASASSASEAMSMILRLQREKAEVQMEFRQFLQSRGQFEDLECRIKQLEESSTQSQPDVELFGTKNVLKKVIVSHSPTYRHGRKSSSDSSSSIYAPVKETTDVAYDLDSSKKKECVHIHLEENSNLKKVDTALEVGDDMSDRVHTVEDIKKLYTRLQALEADRESMRQALISVGTEKAQLVLLKEIAQQLCQDLSLAKTLPVRTISVSGSFSIFSFFKWIMSFVFWRRKARQCRYMLGMSAHNIGLLAVLEKGTWVRRWSSISSTKV